MEGTRMRQAVQDFYTYYFDRARGNPQDNDRYRADWAGRRLLRGIRNDTRIRWEEECYLIGPHLDGRSD